MVGLGLSLAAGSTSLGSLCPGSALDLDHPVLLGVAVADGSGDASFSGVVSASLSGTTVYLQALDVAGCETSNLVAHLFP